jgi:hypothetical protein
MKVYSGGGGKRPNLGQADWRTVDLYSGGVPFGSRLEHRLS